MARAWVVGPRMLSWGVFAVGGGSSCAMILECGALGGNGSKVAEQGEGGRECGHL